MNCGKGFDLIGEDSNMSQISSYKTSCTPLTAGAPIAAVAPLFAGAPFTAGAPIVAVVPLTAGSQYNNRRAEILPRGFDRSARVEPRLYL